MQWHSISWQDLYNTHSDAAAELEDYRRCIEFIDLINERDGTTCFPAQNYPVKARYTIHFVQKEIKRRSRLIGALC